MSGSIARCYAKALLALSQERGTPVETAAELENFTSLVADPQITSVLTNPLLSAARRRSLVRALAEQLALTPITRNFLCLLADHQHLDQLAAIVHQYQRLVDRLLARVRASVTSAAALSTAQQRTLVHACEGVTGLTVLADFEQDRQLLGGVVVEIEGTVYDGSFRTQLNSLAESMSGS